MEQNQKLLLYILQVGFEELKIMIGSWKPLLVKILGTNVKVSIEIDLQNLKIHLLHIIFVKNE